MFVCLFVCFLSQRWIIYLVQLCLCSGGDSSVSSSSSAFPALSLGEIFTYVTGIFIPIMEVATCRLRGWYMLGVFLLSAFTRLGHEHRDLLSPCDGMTRPRFILLPKRVSGNDVRTHVNIRGKKTVYRRLTGGLNPRRCNTQDSEPNTLPTELFRPRSGEDGNAYARARACVCVCSWRSCVRWKTWV